MKMVKPADENKEGIQLEDDIPKVELEHQPPPQDHQNNQHLAFQKNYPKNIFIPLIEHLDEKGFRNEYQNCVGTRQSFQGKNVVSLAQIHKVISQEWFTENINLAALMSNMSNKILMNSKIKKKLFHILLIKQLFAIPTLDAKQFKKSVSRRASQVSQSKLPLDPLFDFPSALIYLLSLFASGLLGRQNPAQDNRFIHSEMADEESRKYLYAEQNSNQNKYKQRETSSKEEYKFYISKIIVELNAYHGDSPQLLELLESVKNTIQQRQREIREKYNLPDQVPLWSHFGSVVVSNCLNWRKGKNKLTHSLLSHWIQQFKDKTTSLSGYSIVNSQNKGHYVFRPIILVYPPQ